MAPGTAYLLNRHGSRRNTEATSRTLRARRNGLSRQDRKSLWLAGGEARLPFPGDAHCGSAAGAGDVRFVCNVVHDNRVCRSALGRRIRRLCDAGNGDPSCAFSLSFTPTLHSAAVLCRLFHCALDCAAWLVWIFLTGAVVCADLCLDAASAVCGGALPGI